MLKQALKQTSLYRSYYQTRLFLRNERVNRSPFFKKYYSNSEFSKSFLVKIDKCCAISLELEFVYCRIPKAANSTVIATLYNAQYHQKEFSREEMNKIKMKGYLKPSQFSQKQLKNLSNFFIFTIARNPYTRLVSAYQDKLLTNSNFLQKTQRDYILTFLGKEKGKEISFSEFLDYLEFSRNGLYVNYHWCRQVDLLPFSPKTMSYIGKMENIENDLKEITRHIFGKYQPMITWNPHSTKKISPKTGNDPKLNLLTPTIRKRIAKLYKDDFETFGYSY